MYSILQPFAFEVKARKLLATYSRLQSKWENRSDGEVKKSEGVLAERPEFNAKRQSKRKNSTFGQIETHAKKGDKIGQLERKVDRNNKGMHKL